MRFIAIFILAFALFPAKAAPQQGSATPVAAFVVEQTYWIRSGKEPQFIALFEKNRVPLLRAKIKEGSLLWVRFSRPPFNANNDQWDLRVTLAWRDADSAIQRLTNAQQSKDGQRLALEQQIIEELIIERTEVPVQEWNVAGGGS